MTRIAMCAAALVVAVAISALHTSRCAQVVTFPEPMKLGILNPEKGNTHAFEFEQIFDPKSTQGVSALVIAASSHLTCW